jgi:hypothetical protein
MCSSQLISQGRSSPLIISMTTTDVDKTPKRNAAWKWAFGMGLVAGLLVLMTLRIDYYNLMNYEPEMSPGIAFMFFPIIFAPLCIMSFAVEFLLRRYWYRPSYWGVSALIGACYASLYVWWAFPDHWYLIFFINPFSLRWTIGVLCKRLTR